MDAGGFTIDMPKSWDLVVAGDCSTLSFVVRDPSQPLRQIFFFGEVGPIYTSFEQKNLDQRAMGMGGQIPWVEMPAVVPFTPEEFLKNFEFVAGTSIARNFMPQCPNLERMQIVSVLPQAAQVQGADARTALVRGVFSEGGKAGEGLFMVTTVPVMPYTGAPGAGYGYAFLFAGVTAPLDEFAGTKDTLTRALGSFALKPAYVENCMRQQNANWQAVRDAGRKLSETSDMIMEGWERRNRSDDIIAAKRSDAILDRERLYNPDSGEVFEFENGFYDRYKVNPEQYRLDNLQLLPDDSHELWTAPTLDGPSHL